MKSALLLLLTTTVAVAQIQSNPTVTVPSQSDTKGGGVATISATTAKATTAVHKPLGDMPAMHGVSRPLFAERYFDITIGTGKLVEPQKLYHVKYSGYLAATGQKFDSSDDHRAPVMKDGKPMIGADGQPELGEAQPLVFPQGTGRMIPGIDQGFEGMRIGGKRRIFIPWQLAYGTRDLPAGVGHIGIPPKSDLIFDVEMVDVTDMPARPAAASSPGNLTPSRMPPVPSKGSTASPGFSAPHPPSTPSGGSAPTAAPPTAPAPRQDLNPLPAPSASQAPPASK
ncbi:MAG TPA: FKBP-type peptidyl-prolyl cis-trans isomerase [Terracidiphilus sp.]|nr:FKBP-type peptidyl-prolyl cis-trans isomerase [Terracidiphilus sp.]